MENNANNVTNPDYDLLTAGNFFGGSDSIRIVILVYIFLSLILNIINVSTFIILRKKLQENFLQSILNLSIVIINFIHTFSYFFQWVIHENDTDYHLINNKNELKVGGLLVGNPNSFGLCSFQAFLLISSSCSQDVLINIIFYMINHFGEFNELKIKLYAIILGGSTPFIFTLIFYFLDGLGLNDQFCYITKFDFVVEEGVVRYSFFPYFKLFVLLVYGFRLINFFITIKFMIEIIQFVRSNNLGFVYIRKTALLPGIQLLTVFIGVIYRASSLFDDSFSSSLSGVYLILNTLDGVLFPLVFAYNNNIFSWFIKILNGTANEKKEEKLTEFLNNSAVDDN